MVNPTVNPMRVLTGSFMEQFLDPLAKWIKFFPPCSRVGGSLKSRRQSSIEDVVGAHR